MPQKAWSATRERQYVLVKESLLDRGKPEPLAEEIAARVVNKERMSAQAQIDPGGVDAVSRSRLLTSSPPSPAT